MREIPRRENGIVVRFLAQTIINDFIFPEQEGIIFFLNNMDNRHAVKFKIDSKLTYYFFLHLEDYGIGDKSELDFILWNKDIIMPVEVKSFTDANSPDVKKEIIRNYLHIETLKNDSKFDFNPEQEIFPILLYSNSYQNWKRGENCKFDYFNKHFLLKKGQSQLYELDKWDKGSYPIPPKYISENFDDVVREINKRLFFITWEKIYDIHIKLNRNNLMGKTIREIEDTEDIFQDEKGRKISLIEKRA